MLAKVYSYGTCGLDAYQLTIEVDVSRGLPATIIVGLPDNAIKESKERVRTAIKNSGFKYIPERITINLAPADTKKEGPSFDLAIALGILAATEQINATNLEDYLFLGELSLDGTLQPINGSLCISLCADKSKFKGIVLPKDNAYEASLSGKIPIYPVKSLSETVQFMHNTESIEPVKADTTKLLKDTTNYPIDFSDVKGQYHVKRGLEIAASGAHNCLLIGPPGSGKSMLAQRLPTILPDMTLEECLEITKIHSIAGLIKPASGIISHRPFRLPHHTSSYVALVGGGSVPKPGEITLAHNGVLFLDELPEFNRNVLETLRQPLEDHQITISRANKSVHFPAQFMLIGAMNPCPCGWFMDRRKVCQCTQHQIQRYLSKISGPLVDRIDIHLEVPSLKADHMLSNQQSESSEQIKQRTQQARMIQKKRFKQSNVHANAQMTHKQIKTFCPLSEEGKKLIKAAIDELHLSARAYDKILKVARTIADLEKEEHIGQEHLAEAIQYRYLDRNWWG